MKSCLFIINPSSGKKTIQKKLDAIIGELVLKEIVNKIDVFYTKHKNDAYKKAFDTNEKQYDFFVSVGGDGTLNEVISGMVDSHKSIPLCILAAGTVNDFANYLQLPSSTAGIIRMIKHFKTTSCDVGKINENYFINVAAGGMFTDVSFEVGKSDKEKFGPLAYYVNGLFNVRSQLSTNLNLNIRVDDRSYDNVEAYLFAVTNTSHVGGFNKIMPYADIKDGLLDIAIIKKCSVTDLIALYKDFKLNKHTNSPFVIFDQGREMEISCLNEDIIVDIDGEKGNHLPVKIENVANAINIIIP